MTFQDYKDNYQDKGRLAKVISFGSISLILTIFILINAGLPGDKSGWFSNFISTIIANIVNTGQDVSHPVVDVAGI